MNGFDVTVLALTAALVLFGLVKGLVRIVITVAALVFAFFVAGHFHPVLAAWMSRLGGSEGTLRLIAWAVLFLGVMLAGGLVAWLLRALLKAALLGWADRLAGAFLGLAAGALASAFLLMPLLAYSPAGQGVLARSALAPYVSVVADLTSRLAPDDLGERYRLRIQELRRRWSGNEAGGAAGSLPGLAAASIMPRWPRSSRSPFPPDPPSPGSGSPGTSTPPSPAS